MAADLFSLVEVFCKLIAGIPLIPMKEFNFKSVKIPQIDFMPIQFYYLKLL